MDEFTYNQIARWLSKAADPIELENWIGNRLLGVKVEENKEWESAYFREKIRKIKVTETVLEIKEIIDQARKIGSYDKEAVLLILDSLEPEGIVELDTLGTAVCPIGMVLPKLAGKTAMEIVVELESREKQKFTVPFDEILILPIPQNTKASLNIKLKETLRINKKNNLKLELSGGTVGIIIDTRGRPLNIPSCDSTGRERINKWLKALELSG